MKSLLILSIALSLLVFASCSFAIDSSTTSCEATIVNNTSKDIYIGQEGGFYGWVGSFAPVPGPGGKDVLPPNKPATVGFILPFDKKMSVTLWASKTPNGPRCNIRMETQTGSRYSCNASATEAENCHFEPDRLRNILYMK